MVAYSSIVSMLIFITLIIIYLFSIYHNQSDEKEYINKDYVDVIIFLSVLFIFVPIIFTLLNISSLTTFLYEIKNVKIYFLLKFIVPLIIYGSLIFYTLDYTKKINKNKIPINKYRTKLKILNFVTILTTIILGIYLSFILYLNYSFMGYGFLNDARNSFLKNKRKKNSFIQNIWYFIYPEKIALIISLIIIYYLQQTFI